MNISENEKKILKFWQDNGIFAKSLAKESPKGDYVFYDGPPFATGLPHYGHIAQSLIKDIIPRYFTMKGYHVERKWGWDCHGLPIENIIETEIGAQSKKDIEDFGIEKFNNACRGKVMMYADEWRKVIDRFGRWVDMDDDYKTMDKDFMESVWWVFKQLWDKGLVYEGYKSMHICPRCETTLSQQEVAEGYKDIKDLSVIAKFELVDEPGTFVLAWTTTPWTLPGNVALAVSEDVKYVKARSLNVEKNKNGEVVYENYIIAKEIFQKTWKYDGKNPVKLAFGMVYANRKE
ncbi:MAG: class I tRNA ligase family protein, partial [Patescibacteria group bacterium]